MYCEKACLNKYHQQNIVKFILVDIINKISSQFILIDILLKNLFKQVLSIKHC